MFRTICLYWACEPPLWLVRKEDTASTQSIKFLWLLTAYQTDKWNMVVRGWQPTPSWIWYINMLQGIYHFWWIGKEGENSQKSVWLAKIGWPRLWVFVTGDGGKKIPNDWVTFRSEPTRRSRLNVQSGGNNAYKVILNTFVLVRGVVPCVIS